MVPAWHHITLLILTMCQTANLHKAEHSCCPPFALGLALCSPAHSKSIMLHLHRRDFLLLVIHHHICQCMLIYASTGVSCDSSVPVSAEAGPMVH